MFTPELSIMFIYRLLALFVAIMMALVLWREKNCRTQFFAFLVFIPFVLRAVGVK